jgi:hypothetical protein
MAGSGVEIFAAHLYLGPQGAQYRLRLVGKKRGIPKVVVGVQFVDGEEQTQQAA